MLTVLKILGTIIIVALLTLARACYFPILERTWGGVATPMPFRP